MTTARRVATCAVVASIAIAPGMARAEPPKATVTGCAFDAAALERALVVELQGQSTPPIAVACAGETATITLMHPDRAPVTRVVDLADVPGPLAARVVALVAVATANESPPVDGVRNAPDDREAPGGTGSRPSEDRSATEHDAASPAAGAQPTRSDVSGGMGPTGARSTGDVPGPSGPPGGGDARGAAAASRSSLMRDGLGGLRPSGVAARGLARIHDGTTTLWGAGAAVTMGPAAVGLTAAGTRVEHTLGTLTPWVVAADAALTVTCAGAACASIRGELGRVWVAADASDPMMVSSHALAATYLHGAAEVSLDARLGGVDVAATAAIGASRGVVARAGDEAAAVLAGWTFTGALEVRR